MNLIADRRWAPLLRLLLGVAVAAAVLVVWQVHATRRPSFFLPTPTTVVDRGVDIWTSASFRVDVTASVRRFAAGYVAGAAVAVVLGAITGSSRRARRLLDPVIELARSVPPIALLPAAVVTIGFNDGMRISIIAFGVFFPVYVATFDGVRQVPREMLDAAALFHLTRSQAVRRVLLPAALPAIAAGLRTAVAVALVMVVVAELVGTERGLGAFIIARQHDLDAPAVYAGLLFLGALGYLLNAAFSLLERRMLRWHEGNTGRDVR